MHVDHESAAREADRGSALERLLCDAVRAAFARAGVRAGGVALESFEALADAIQSVTLDDAERALLAADPGDDADLDRARMDRWIELRLGRALELAVARIAAAADVSPPPVPRVVVVRGGHDARDRRADARGSADASDRGSSGTRAIAGAPGDVLVVADASGIDRILERHRSLWIAEKNVRLRFRAGLDDRRQTVGLEPRPGEGGVEVVEGSTVLRELGIVLERARLELSTGVEPAPREVEDLSGTILGGKYELQSRIGRGGFGSVYRARDLRLDHCVAVKVLNREGRSLAALTALREEARRLTRLDHPNIVDWKTFDEAEDGTGYIVMELLEGEDLEEIFRRERRLPPQRVAHVLHEIAQALCAAHTLGDGGSILHLDLKPRNVFVLTASDARGRDRVKVIDFGIAQHGARAMPWAPSDELGAEGLSVDPDGTVRSVRAAALPVLAGGSSRAAACTPEYAAPEHVAHLLPEYEALPLDGRADVYSLGVIGFQLLAGELPFEAPVRARHELLRRKTTSSAPPLASVAPHVPRGLARFVDRCLERDRELRFASAEEACEALRRIVDRSKARRWIAAATASTLLSAGVAWHSRSAPAPALEAFVQASDGEHPLAGQRLCFGPDSSPARLRIEDAAGASALVAARIVASCEPDAAEIAGTTAELAGPNEVRVRVADWEEATARGAFLETRRADGATKHSAAFSLLYVPDDALRVDSAGFEGLGARALDPRGAWLDVTVAGRIDLVERVEVGDGAVRLDARADEARTGDAAGVWTLDAALFRWDDGARELAVAVFDVAGGVRHAALRVDVASTDLEWSVDGDAPRFGERWSLTPSTAAHAFVRANRRADFAWRAVDEAGTLLASGRRSATTALELDLRQVVESAGGQSFDGFLEITADERAYVLHARPPRDAVRRVPIQYRAEPPSVRAWIVPCPTRPEVALAPGGVAYAPCRRFDLRVARDCEQPLRYEIEAIGSGARAAAFAPVRGELGDRVRASEVVPLALAADGACIVRIRAWRLDGASRDGGASPEFEQTSTIVVQSQPGALAVSGPAGLVVRDAAGSFLKLVVRAGLPAGWEGGPAAPVAVRWTLIGPGPRDVAAAGTLDGELAGGGSADLSIALPQRTRDGAPDADDLDGAWRVEVAGTDAAGNEAAVAAFAFHVARSGPRAELLVPLADVPWERGEHGFELRVAACDANGVARVACRLRLAGTRGPEIVAPLERDGYSAVGTLWRGSVDLPLSWSRAAVEVAIGCEDGYGLRSETAAEREVARIDADLPARIRVEFAGRAIAPMRLVRGNDAGVYVFGGRGDDLENDLFRRAGLYAFNALRASRSWRIELPAGAIGDYYLDEREVTNAEYLEFVRAPDGYADAGHWPASGAHGAERRIELLERLAASDPRLPVADVDWSEAAAYARWCGKELPSALQWEHALRGGAAYRPHPAWDPERPDPRPAFLSANRAHAAGELGDVTPDTRIADLAANVGEWTSTLALAPTPIEPAVDAAGAQAADRRWVAGGSWTSPRRDFSTLDRRRGDSRAPTIGFRCCLPARTFLERLEDRAEPLFGSCP